MTSPADNEIAQGRLWRAREMLRGRLAMSGYDPVLFAQLADVLAQMHDDDEAGRYYLLAGRSEGHGGDLARAFLARRSRRSITQLWSQMPAAARRGIGHLPLETLTMLQAAGFQQQRIKAHLADLERRSQANRDGRKKKRLQAAVAARGERIGLVIAAILLVILTVGLVGTLRLIWWALDSLFHLV